MTYPLSKVDEAWNKYKNGFSWSKYTPICRTETSHTHRQHMIFVQGYNAALKDSEGQHCSGCSGWESWGPFDEGHECYGV